MWDGFFPGQFLFKKHARLNKTKQRDSCNSAMGDGKIPEQIQQDEAETEIF
ncbi:hypothetical protein L195_g024375 [Trifolium pratense]|uniref:Uncharacterized protein n=1 Tax=Trifolium pratense TaxID=57577 RepID=A0A2K3NDH3_TRIPR|nr:hypothetical protein L195_g024375 [Trifolium pratense]